MRTCTCSLHCRPAADNGPIWTTIIFTQEDDAVSTFKYKIPMQFNFEIKHANNGYVGLGKLVRKHSRVCPLGILYSFWCHEVVLIFYVIRTPAPRFIYSYCSRGHNNNCLSLYITLQTDVRVASQFCNSGWTVLLAIHYKLCKRTLLSLYKQKNATTILYHITKNSWTAYRNERVINSKVTQNMTHQQAKQQLK